MTLVTLVTLFPFSFLIEKSDIRKIGYREFYIGGELEKVSQVSLIPPVAIWRPTP